jgi:hypothetical protein
MHGWTVVHAGSEAGPSLRTQSHGGPRRMDWHQQRGLRWMPAFTRSWR